MEIADLKDVTPDTSSDDIKAYAEQVINEVKAERAGESKPEGKSDAEIVNSTSQPATNTKETPAEKNSGSNTVPEDEKAGNASEGPEWLTDDVKAEAAVYGINESEIADFASREELDRALKLFDKTALEAGRKAMAEGEATTRNEKGRFVKKEEPKADPPTEQAPADGRYQVSLSKDLYDEEIIGEFNRMHAFYESRFAALESRFAEEAAVQQFDSLVDSLGHADLFGTTGKETEEELQRRRDLNVNVNAHMIGLAKLGRPTEMSQQLISRVANMTFGDQIQKKLLKQKTRNIARQSNSRLGGSPTKPQPPSDNPRDRADRLYREMSGS